MTSFLPFLLLQVGIFLGLAVLLRWVLSRNLTGATTQLQNLSAEYTRRHEELKQRLQEAQQQYQDHMTRAKTEAEQMVSAARQEAEAARVRLLEEARAESERIVQQGMENREALRKELEETMETRVITRACELIQQVLPGQLREGLQSLWLDELIRNGFSHLEGIATQEAIEEVRVVSAFSLNEEQRRLLREQLKKKFGRELPLREETNPQLVAGLTITLGSVVLDGSLASKLLQAVRDAQHPA